MVLASESAESWSRLFLNFLMVKMVRITMRMTRTRLITLPRTAGNHLESKETEREKRD